MKIFQRVKRFFFRNLSVTDEKAWNPSLWNLAGSQSLSGENVTEETALTCSAIWEAIYLISSTIASLPLHLMQRKGDVTRMAEDKPAHKVMHRQANKYMTAFTFKQCMMANLLLFGNSYAEIVRNGYGDVIELWPIVPSRIKEIKMIEGEIYYIIHMYSEQDIVLPASRILHLRGIGLNGFTGLSLIGMARKSIGLGMAMESFGSRYFGQGTHPGIVVTHPSKLGTDGHKNLRDSLLNTYSGLGQSHRLMLLEDGMKLEKLLIAPNDSQFLESRQFQIQEVCRWFDLPPHTLKDLTRSSFSNIESEQMAFQQAIQKRCEPLEEEYDLQLLSDTDKDQSGRGRYYFKHNLDGLLRADAQAQAALFKTYFEIGLLSQNEMRKLKDWDPVPGGDERYVPLNMIPISKIDDYLQSTIDKKQDSNPEPAPNEPATLTPTKRKGQ